MSYTRGTTGDPKGVVTHHRGAYLNAACNAVTWTMPHFPVPVDAADVPLQRLVLSVDGGDARRHARLPAPGRAKAILDAMREHGVDHYCAAPIVHNLIVNAPADWRDGIGTRCAAWSPAPRRRRR